MIFIKLDDFLPFIYFMVERSLNNKHSVLLIQSNWKKIQSLNHVDNLKPLILIKSGSYIEPSPSAALF